MAKDGTLSIEVRCYAGHRGDETPRSFDLGTRTIEVREILGRWLGPDHRYFEVLSPDGDRYTLRREGKTDRWELTRFSRAGS